MRTKKNLLRRREEIKAELKSPLSAVQTEKLSSGKKKNDRSDLMTKYIENLNAYFEKKFEF